MIEKVEIISQKCNKKSKAPDVLRNQTFGFSFLWATILRNGATLVLPFEILFCYMTKCK